MASQAAGPPGPDISRGPLLIGLTTFLHAISLPLFVARIWTRVRPTMRLGLDDYFITAAIIFDMLEWIPLLISIHYGVGRHNYYISPDDMVLAEKYLFISQPPYAWSLTCSKLSIIWMLIRIQRENKVWKAFLYFMMVFAVGTAVTMNSFQFSLCKPLWAVWDHSNPDAVCMDPKIAQASIYATAAMTIVTDIILSLLPMTFIVSIYRPLREKLVLGFIMGLGIFASGASIAKTVTIKDYGITGDDLMDSVGITIWSVLEMQLAIIASCIPTLRQPFEKFLRRFGLLTSQNKSTSYYPKTDGPNSHHFALSDVRSKQRTTRGGPDADAESVESQLPIMQTKGDQSRVKTTIASRNAGWQSDKEDQFVEVHTSVDPGAIRKHTTVSVYSSSGAA